MQYRLVLPIEIMCCLYRVSGVNQVPTLDNWQRGLETFQHWYLWKHLCISLGLPWWLRWERICLKCRRPGFDPRVGKIHWRKGWQPTPVFLSGEFPWTEETGRLQSMVLQRVRHNWVTNTFTLHFYIKTRHLANPQTEEHVVEFFVSSGDQFSPSCSNFPPLSQLWPVTHMCRHVHGKEWP